MKSLTIFLQSVISRFRATKKTIEGSSILAHCIVIFAVTLLIHGWYSTTHVVFGQDQARDSATMQRLYNQKALFIPYGPKASVANFSLAPLYYQIHYIFSYISGQNPLIMTVVITIVESFTPVVLYLLLTTFLNKLAALNGAFLYSVSALVVTFSTFAWNPNLIPLLLLSSVYLSVVGLQKNKGILFTALCVLITLALHFHYQTALVLPFFAMVFGIDTVKNKGKNIKFWISGALLAIVFTLPYVLSELSNNWMNTRQIIHFFMADHVNFYDRVSKPDYVLYFFPAFIERIIWAHQTPYELIGKLIFFPGLFALMVISMKNQKARLVLLYFFVIFVMLRIYKGDKIDYYMSPLFILPSVLLACLAHFTKALGITVAAIVILFCILSLISVPHFNNFTSYQNASSFIGNAASNGEARVVFYNDDYINIFAPYFLDNTSPRFNTKSPTLIEICEPTHPCSYGTENYCAHSRGYTYTAFIKSGSGYTYSRSLATSSYTIQSGTVQKYTANKDYPLYAEINEFGSDILLPQAYDEWK